MIVTRSSADFRALDHGQRIDALVEIQRCRATLDAEEQRLLAVIDADPARDPERRDIIIAKGFVREEVACALRLAFGTTQSRLHVARTLVDRFPATLDALAAGDITYWHCRRLVELSKDLDESVSALVEERVLPGAASQTVGEFAAAIRKSVHLLDPADSADRHQRAAKDRRVEHYPGQDGMATVWALLPAPDAQTVTDYLDRQAGRPVDPGDERTMDQRRADALTDLAQNAADPGGSARPGRKPAVQVTVALSTLLGLDEQPGQLAGYGSIPAEAARELAFDPTGTWRRLVTDECGRLIDVGSKSYRPPAPLAAFVIARDQTCRIPACNRKACTCDLDHVIPWPTGPTDAENLHALCCRHHHLKHEAGWKVERAPDGATIWITPTGRRHEKPPATYPIDHTDEERERGAA